MDFLEHLEKTKLIEEKIEAHRRLLEQLSTERKSIHEKPENLLSDYSSLTPLNLVNTIETLYPSIIHSSKIDSLNALSSYKSSHNIKFDLLDFELKKNISDKLKQKMEEITCIILSEENIFIGNNNGIVKMYEIETGNEIKSFSLNQNNSPVSVLENKGDEYLFTGNNDGTINVFDIKKGNLSYSIKDNHSTKILAIKIINIDKNIFKIISSDEKGKIMLEQFSLSKLKKKSQNTLILQHINPIYTILKFNPIEDESKCLLGFASIDKVFLYSLEPNLEKIFELKKPDYVEENEIPDISLGLGGRPMPKTGTKKLSETGNLETFFAVSWGNVILFYCIIFKAETFIPEGPIGYFENNIGITRMGFISTSIIYFFDKTTQLKIINTSFCDYGKYEANEDKKFIYNKNALIDEGKILDPHMKRINISKNKDIQLYSYINYIHTMKNCIYLFTKEGLRIGKILSYQDCIEDIIKKSNNWFGAMCLAIDIYQGNMTSFPGVPSEEEERKKKLEPDLKDLLNKYIEYNFKKTETEEGVDEDVIDMKEDKIIECINVSIEFCLGIKIFDYLLNNVEKTFSKYGKEDMFYKLLEPFIFNDLLINEQLSETFLILLYKTYKNKGELVLLSHLFIHINLNCLSSPSIQKLILDENLFTLIIYIFSNSFSYEDFFLPINKMFQYFLTKSEEEFFENDENNDEYRYFNYTQKYGEMGYDGLIELDKSKVYVGHKLLWYIELSLKGNKLSTTSNFELSKFNISSESYKYFISLIFYWILQENVFLTLLNFDSYSFFSILSMFFTEPTIIKIIQEFNFSLFSDEQFTNIIEVNIPEKEKQSEGKEYNKEVNIKYNDLNEVLLYIIKLTESQSDFLSHQDLDYLLIKFASLNQNLEEFPELLRTKIFEALNNNIKFFSNYAVIRHELIKNKKDKFNCHSLSNDKIEINDLYFSKISKNVIELLNSETYTFSHDELLEFSKSSENIPFITIKIKIQELLDNYDKCLEIFLENKNEKFQSEVFNWLDKIFSNYQQIIEDEKNKTNNEIIYDNKEENKGETISNNNKDLVSVENGKNLEILKEELDNLRKVVIIRIEELAKINLNEAKDLIAKYFLNDDKLTLIEKLKKNPELQLEFLNQLLNPIDPSYSNKTLIEELDTDKQYSFYFSLKSLFNKLYIKEKENKREKKIQEKFEKFFLLQISLLIQLKSEKILLKYLEVNIKLYPNYPLRLILNECIDNDILDATIFLYQALGESKNALNLNKTNLDSAFISYLKDEIYDDKSEFLEKLNICINICKENSESLTKKEIAEESKETHKEGEDLWFNLLETLYKYEEDCEKNQKVEISSYRRKKVQNRLQKIIAELLKQMCLYVGIQNLVEYVTENQNRAQYKEFKSILESMLRTNTSFNRVIDNTMTILKRAINSYENERKRVTLKGNNYNYKKCDVCQNFFDSNKNEVMLCFGCGHQSHKKCSYKKKLNKDEIIDENEFTDECMICHQNEIEEDEVQKEKEVELKEMNDFYNKEDEEKRREKRSKNDKIRKLNKYDKIFENEMAMFY